MLGRLNSIKPKTDCFAYNKNDRGVESCSALNALYCKCSFKCAFYKKCKDALKETGGSDEN